MVIETSALVAMLTNEPESERFEAAVEADPVRLMSTASYLEAAIVVEQRFGEPGGRELDLWLHRAGVDLVGKAAVAVRLWSWQGSCGARDARGADWTRMPSRVDSSASRRIGAARSPVREPIAEYRGRAWLVGNAAILH